jgi:hypothetical protein
MPSIRSVLRTGFVSIAAIMLVASFPLSTFADDGSDSSTTTCTAPTSTQNGVHVPTGSAAKTFTYQCSGQYQGEWTNQYYVYDPATDTTSPLYSPNYSYDCSSDIWTMDSWDYDAATGQYNDDRIDTSAPSGVSTGCPVIADSDPSSASQYTNSAGSDTTGTNSGSADTATNSPNNATSTTGSGSTNTATTNNNSDTNLTNGTATSGNSLVLANTTAGDAATGAVEDEANIINMLQSSSNALGTGNNVVTFTDNINGNVDGNLLLDPSTLGEVQPASTNTDTANTNNTVTVNNSTGENINNNINVAADSGDANVSENTEAGNATSGTAEAIANVVNLMNSAITAGNSFIGTININGDLDGNILIPANFVNELLADNVPTVNISAPSSDNTSTTTSSSNTNITNTNNEGINNNVNATANSGNATVADNSSAGNATSGQATTNLTAFNLTGSNVIGSNDLLVFVNVMGSWVGMIMNAPAGTTAAEIGGGITNDTNTTTNNTTANNTANESINNNINANAQSGSAAVSKNTIAGNATSGNADTAVNLANIEGSTISLNGWFGILFINVFGTWDGSFGVNPTASTGSSNVESVTPAEASSILSHSPVFGYTSSNDSASSSPDSDTGTTAAVASPITPTESAGDLSDESVLADKTVKTPANSGNLQTSHSTDYKTIGVIGGLVALYIIGDAIISRRKRHSAIR